MVICELFKLLYIVIEVDEVYVFGLFGLKLFILRFFVLVGKFRFILIDVVVCGVLVVFGSCNGVVLDIVVVVIELFLLIGKICKYWLEVLIIKLFLLMSKLFVWVYICFWLIWFGDRIKKLLLLIVKFKVWEVKFRLFCLNSCWIFCNRMSLFIVVLLLLNVEFV